MVRNELKFPKVNLAQIAQYEKRINDEALSGEIGYYFLPQLGESVICETQEFLNGKEFNEICEFYHDKYSFVGTFIDALNFIKVNFKEQING